MGIVRYILRAEILVAIGFFAGCGVGGVLAGISVTGPFGVVPFWGGLVALTLLFAMLVRGRAVRVWPLPATSPRAVLPPSQSETVR